jgi:hypothetical protein
MGILFKGVKDIVEPTRKKPGPKVLDVDFTPEQLAEYQEVLREQARFVKQSETELRLDEDLIRLAYVMVDPRTGSTISDWCRVAQCDRLKYYRHRDDKVFTDFVQQVIKERRKVHTRVKANRALEAEIDGRNVKAIRLFYELEGELIHRSENTNVTETAEERQKRLRAQEALKGSRPVAEQPAEPEKEEDDTPF